MNYKRLAPHQENGRFFNHPGEKKESVVFRSAAMYLWGWRVRNSRKDELAAWHTHETTSRVGSEKSFHSGPVVTWIGHSTFLVQFQKCNVLTDPIFGDITLFFKRLQRPGIALSALPRIDAVVISHNHRDHMDKASLIELARLWPHCIFYVPKGDRHWLNSWGIQHVIELDWYEKAHPVLGAQLTFLPAVHWSQRSFFDYNKSLWGSWMLEADGQKIYFAGDTAYGEHFAEIGKEHTAIDCALMPIGPCEPRAWMTASHISAEDAGKAFLELGAQTFVPMHWGTFTFGLDNPLLPIERMLAWWQTAERSQVLVTPKMGQEIMLQTGMKSLILSGVEGCSEFQNY